MPKQETTFVIPGTDVELPPWALLAGGAGVLAALFFMKGDSTPSGMPSGLVGEEMERRIRESEEGQASAMAAFLEEIMLMLQGLQSPALPVTPLPRSIRDPIRKKPKPDIVYIPPVLVPTTPQIGTAEHGIKRKLPKQITITKELPPEIRKARGYITTPEIKAQTIIRSVADIIRQARKITVGAIYPPKPKVIPTQPQQPKQGAYY